MRPGSYAQIIPAARPWARGAVTGPQAKWPRRRDGRGVLAPAASPTPHARTQGSCLRHNTLNGERRGEERITESLCLFQKSQVTVPGRRIVTVAA
jgi:hypothetical protein